MVRPIESDRSTEVIVHGKQETSQAPRVTCIVLHAAMVAVAAWIYYGSGAAFFSSLVGRTDPVPGDPVRYLVLMVFSLLVFIRILLTFFVLLKRQFPWGEFWGSIKYRQNCPALPKVTLYFH